MTKDAIDRILDKFKDLEEFLQELDYFYPLEEVATKLGLDDVEEDDD